MNLFEKTYTIKLDKNQTHTFNVGDVYYRVCFLTKNGIAPHSIENFTGWFFPKIVNPPTAAEDTELDKVFSKIQDEYKMALNDLIAANLVSIQEGEHSKVFINLTEEGLKYSPKIKTIDYEEELTRLKLYSKEIAELESKLPADKKGFFKSLF
jgi:hypothetical protein